LNQTRGGSLNEPRVGLADTESGDVKTSWVETAHYVAGAGHLRVKTIFIGHAIDKKADGTHKRFRSASS
jgi:hypothetical protein